MSQRRCERAKEQRHTLQMFYMVVPVVWGTNPVIISFIIILVWTNVPKSTFVKYDPFLYLNGEGVRGLMPQK